MFQLKQTKKYSESLFGVSEYRADLVSSEIWRRKWQPTPVFLPGESQGQRSLVGYCLWGCTELDMTEAT